MAIGRDQAEHAPRRRDHRLPVWALPQPEESSTYALRLRRLVDQAWDLKHEDSPYYIDAVHAIVDFHEHQFELDVQDAEAWLASLDPFVRECVVALLGDRQKDRRRR